MKTLSGLEFIMEELDRIDVRKQQAYRNMLYVTMYTNDKKRQDAAFEDYLSLSGLYAKTQYKMFKEIKKEKEAKYNAE